MSDFPFECVVFDLDGTLVATDRFWVPAARAGARRAFDDLGIQRELPSAEEWMGMVGYPLEEGFRRVFSDLEDEARGHVLRCVVDEEESALRAGGAALLPGAQPMLEELARRGVRLGIASNCGGGYLETMMKDLGLERWIETGRCLATPGVHSKADMVSDLLTTFGSRSAVMVGDRRGDCEAAHANGIPHVHLTGGFASHDERVPAEAVIDDLHGLIPRLLQRDAWIAELLTSIDLDPGGSGGPRTVGITGPPLAGKTLLTRDLARVLRASGRLVRVVRVASSPGDVDPFAAVAGELAWELVSAPDEPREALFNGPPKERGLAVGELVAGVLEPFWRGAPGHAEGSGPAPERPAPRRNERGPEVLLLDGPYLLHPRIASRLDRVLYLDIGVDVATRRLAARAGEAGGATPRELERWREGPWSDALALASHYGPERADRLLDGGNPLTLPSAGSRAASRAQA